MILKDLPIGTKVRENRSALVFLVADHNHTSYIGTALLTDCAIKLASFDAAEPDNPDQAMKEHGNNFYPQSNIHRWLNSDQADWYKPAHEFDAPPVREYIDQGRLDFYGVPFHSTEAKFLGDFSYKDDPGFLTRFSPAFVERVCEVDVQCYNGPDSGASPEVFYAKSKVFLLSAPEMGFETVRTGDQGFRYEGFRFPLFNDPRMRVVAPMPAAIGKPSDYIYDDCSIWYWLRTSGPGSRSVAMAYNSEHKRSDSNGTPTTLLPVWAICGIRPVLNLDSRVTVSDEPDALGIYTLLLGDE